MPHCQRKENGRNLRLWPELSDFPSENEMAHICWMSLDGVLGTNAFIL
jgi:hypothetical protein